MEAPRNVATKAHGEIHERRTTGGGLNEEQKGRTCISQINHTKQKRREEKETAVERYLPARTRSGLKNGTAERGNGKKNVRTIVKTADEKEGVFGSTG